MKDIIVYSTVVILLLLVFSIYAEAAETSVSVRPGNMNSFQCNSITGKIIIQADKPGKYGISIEGVPESWLEYAKSVYVDGEETVNYIVNPQNGGTYYLTLLVNGPGGYYFEKEVRLWVSKKETADLDAPDEDEGDSIEGGFTGMFTFSEQDQGTMTIMIVVIAAVFAVFLGHKSLRKEEPYDDMGLNF